MRSLRRLLPRHILIGVTQAFSRAAFLALRAGHIRPSASLARFIGPYSTILAMAQAAERGPRQSSGERGRVLFYAAGPCTINALSFQLALYRFLEVEGYKCHLVICDRFLESCEALKRSLYGPARGAACTRCYQQAQDACQAAGVPFTRASEVLSGADLTKLNESESRVEALGVDELVRVTADGIALGKHAFAASLRFLKRGTLPEDDGEARDALLRDVKSAMRSKALSEACIEQYRPGRVVLNHGFYSPWGPAREVFGREGIPVAVFETSPVFQGAYVTSWNKPSLACDVRRTFLGERGSGLNPTEREALRQYLASRRMNSRDKVQFNLVPEVDRQETREALGIPIDARCFGLFPNLFWDAATVARDVVFRDQIEWILSTLRYFERHPDRWLIVRPHPAEAIRGTKQSVAAIVRAAYPSLPKNVRLLDEAFRYNAYSVFNAIDVGVVNTSTVGLEMSLLGLPVVAVSDTHYRGLGFTIDPKTQQEYFESLESLSTGDVPHAPALDEAERYAHLYFFRHHLRLPFFNEHDRSGIVLGANLDHEQLRDEPGLQAWMHAFATGGDFVLPRDEIGLEASTGVSSGRG